MYEALRGVKGFVMDEESGLPVRGAQMHIKGRQREFNTTIDGEYWRILLNGSYILQVPTNRLFLLHALYSRSSVSGCYIWALFLDSWRNLAANN